MAREKNPARCIAGAAVYPGGMQRTAVILLHAALGMTAGGRVTADGIRWLPDHSAVEVIDVEKAVLPAAG